MAGRPTVDGEPPIGPLPLPPGRSHPAHDTYIVQVPKDQVYRVPPPENAVIFEQHRNPGKQKKRKSPCRTWCSLIILVILILIGGASAAVYFSFKPKNPQFSVEKFQIKNTPSKKTPNAVPQYFFSMTAKNPNSKTGLSYRKGGDATLYYDNIPVAAGKTPALGQGKGDSSMMAIGLAGVKGRPMNPDMKKSMNETNKGDIPISFELENEIQVIGKIEGLRVYSMDLIVNCRMKVSSLRSNARVLTQKCKTEKK